MTPNGTTTAGNALRYRIRPDNNRLDPTIRAKRCRDAVFGHVFTKHMATLRWDPNSGWRDGCVQPLAPLSLHPMTVGLHHGQIIFEGLKACPPGSTAAPRRLPASGFTKSSDLQEVCGND